MFRWDDVVDETRIKPINDETMAERDRLKEEIEGNSASKKKSKPGASGANKSRRSTGAAVNSDRDSEARSSNAPGRGTKRGREDIETVRSPSPAATRHRHDLPYRIRLPAMPEVEQSLKDLSLLQEEAFHARPTIHLPTPEPIKSSLVDDWENVTKNLQLVPLPHPRATIADIFAEYHALEEAKRTNPTDRQLLDEVIKGFEEYFNRCLGRILLYRLERPQWLDVLELMEKTPVANSAAADEDKGGENRKGKAAKKQKAVPAESSMDPAAFAGKTPTQVYGAEHLCRLLVTLPELLSQTNIDGAAVTRLREELVALTAWLSQERERFFLHEYQNAGQDYLAKVKGGY